MNTIAATLSAKILGALCLSGVLAGLLVLAGPAAAAPASTSTTITFTEVVKGSTFEFVDNPPKQKSEAGPISAGDQFVATSPLVMGGKTVGKERIACTATSTSKSFEGAHFLCSGAFVLPAGQIFLEAIVGAPHLEGAVTGGTGAYAGASGSFSVKERKTSSVVTVTLLE
jgi:hypothetical protein